MKTLIVLENFEVQESIINSLVSAGIDMKNIIPCSYKDAGLFIKDLSIQVFLMEMSSVNSVSAFQMMDLIKTTGTMGAIIPVLTQKDTDLILQLIKRGVADILLCPIDTTELQNIIRKFSNTSLAIPTIGGAGDFKGKVVTVTSYKGGTGVSTIAANIAFCFSELEAIKKKTLILDLANQSNHCSMLLSAQQNSLTIHSICNEVARMESAYIFSSCSWITPNLAIIGTDSDIRGMEEIKFEALSSALDLFTQAFEYVVIDLPTHCFDNKFLVSIDKADQVLLVSTIDITAIRDSRLYMSILKSVGADANKTRLLINRYDCDSGMFKTKDLEQSLQSAISFYVPNDFRTMVEAAQSGQAVLDCKPNSMLAEALAELAIGLDSGVMFVPPKVDVKKKPSGGLSSLLGLRK